jgi:predicted GH43/DUF377 family glycosyl hydrolase
MSEAREVSVEEMGRVYEAVRTPFKHGPVVRGEEGKPVDCPSVFRHAGRWYMMYVCMNRVGYETHLARSGDLLYWEPMGRVLSFGGGGRGGQGDKETRGQAVGAGAARETGVSPLTPALSPEGEREQEGPWDRWQVDGGVALVDYVWGGSSELGMFDGRYWMSYIGGARQGYETDPLAIGVAWTRTPDRAVEWNRIEENPVLAPWDADVRDFEAATLYKSNIIHDREERLGWPFVMYYNGKQKGRGIERIGMAVSRDMVRWKRYGAGPVIDNEKGISGDPQIVRMGDLWVMFYFGHVWKPRAFDTFACSRDLVHWTKWDGPHLVEPSEEYDSTFAHKPWVLKHEGVVYHYYCAVKKDERVIAVATSREV